GAALTAEIVASVRRNEDWESAVAAARGMRRRELLRVAVADLLGLAELDTVGTALSDVAAATLEAALQTAVQKVETERRAPLPVRLAVIGMGRLGGAEQGYGSDADVMFVYQPANTPETGDGDSPAHTQAAHDVANEMRRLLALPAPDPPLVVDADLRPEGRQGPLVRSLSSYAEYYRRWSAVWESQALLRARPVAGDAELGARFVQAIDPVRYPEGGIDAATAKEIRRLKARMESERLPRGADPTLHTKLGRGGLADVEWTVQLLQLRYASTIPELRTTSTLPALAAAQQHGLLDAEQAEILVEAWQLAMRVRNAIVLARGRPADAVPTDPRSLAAVARAMGYAAGQTQDMVEDYLRATRRARTVYEAVFFA
ncbi:MAG: [glutamine synthetase] adenylyltransferase / [glutamine synthetase]-adenylyl-L-tyrosine, partial [Frankiaceae bacterium]|nr:[glutamine synthetase] adenylyltransferase / [glutamine synthetase]-adenylyl-L-tyrosine [Frankiaceae bacterium]